MQKHSDMEDFNDSVALASNNGYSQSSEILVRRPTLISVRMFKGMHPHVYCGQIIVSSEGARERMVSCNHLAGEQLTLATVDLPKHATQLRWKIAEALQWPPQLLTTLLPGGKELGEWGSVTPSLCFIATARSP